MLRGSVNKPGDPLIFMGLEEGNVERLKAGFPIKAEIRSFGVDMPGHVVVVYGKTAADIMAALGDAGVASGPPGYVEPRVDQEAEARRRHEKILIATVGLPRSGKTTWARSQAYPVVNPDSIRLALHGKRFYGPAEQMVWATAKLMVRSLFLAGHRHVILDATNTTRARRDEWRSPEWGLFFKSIDASEDVCLARAAESSDEEIGPVIQRMAAAMQPLGPDEPRW